MIDIVTKEEIPAAMQAMRKRTTLEAVERLRNALGDFHAVAARQKHKGETLEEKSDRRNRATAYRHALVALSKIEGLFSVMAKGF